MSPQEWVVGKWKVTKVQGYSESGFENLDEKKFIGKNLIVTGKTIEFKEIKANIKDIEIEKGDTRDIFYSGFNMNPYKLKLPKEITLLTLDHDNSSLYIYNIFMVGSNSLVFEYGGIFFRAIRTK
jgi:hypothetical protein